MLVDDQEIERTALRNILSEEPNWTTTEAIEPRGPEDVWRHAAPTSVEIKPFRSIREVQVAIRAAWDEEHTLGALIRDARLVELNGSILEPR